MLWGGQCGGWGLSRDLRRTVEGDSVGEDLPAPRHKEAVKDIDAIRLCMSPRRVGVTYCTTGDWHGKGHEMGRTNGRHG